MTYDSPLPGESCDHPCEGGGEREGGREREWVGSSVRCAAANRVAFWPVIAARLTHPPENTFNRLPHTAAGPQPAAHSPADNWLAFILLSTHSRLFSIQVCLHVAPRVPPSPGSPSLCYLQPPGLTGIDPELGPSNEKLFAPNKCFFC